MFKEGLENTKQIQVLSFDRESILSTSAHTLILFMWFQIVCSEIMENDEIYVSSGWVFLTL
jgi:hypothetical protein